MVRLIVVLVVFSVSVTFGQYKTKRTYDYSTGSALSTTSSGDRSRTHDYSTGNTYNSRTNSAGTTATYDYGSGTSATTKKNGAGYSTYDNGSYSTTTKRGNSLYNNSDDQDMRKRAIAGALADE